MTILLEPTQLTAETIRPVIGGAVEVVDTLPAVRRLLDTTMHEVVVVGPDVDLALALQFANELRMVRPALGVIVIRRRVDSSVLGEAMRHGVREVISMDDLPTLPEACRRSVELTRTVLGVGPATEGAQGQLLTVFSPKGGAGKTTLATNLAAACAGSGRRRVCLLDLDLAFGDVAIALQLAPARTISDAGALGEPDETAVASLITPHSPGLDTILAPVEPGAAERVPAALVASLLTVLKRMYDVVIVDCPPAMNDHVLAAFDQTDHFILLATLDVPALKNLKIALETLELLDYDKSRWHVVLNRADSKVGLNVADVAKTLRLPVAVQVPSSRAVPTCINRGVPIVLDQPNHSVSVAIRRLAETTVLAAIPGAVPARKERRVLPFLNRAGVTA